MVDFSSEKYSSSTRVDQNMGGALLEFPVRTAMHRKSRVLSATKCEFYVGPFWELHN